ncbi:MAG TPA: spore germination protein GerW family protein [Armatimonadota bacterium]|nr:spore germination protein GerW family protein [Armatimonadota bacterium]
MDISQVRDLLNQIQAGARVTTAIGDPVTVGERVVIPVVEVAYGGGGGGGAGKAPETEQSEGSGGGGGGGVRVRPLGCWVVGPTSERWIPAIDANRLMIVAGTLVTLLFVTIRALAKRR